MSQTELRVLLTRMTNNLAISMLLLDSMRDGSEPVQPNVVNTVFTLQQEVLRTLQTLEAQL